MTELHPFVPPDVWLVQLFNTRAARARGGIRRKVRDVERIIDRGAFLRELQRRGYHAVENAGQFVIFCNNEEVRVLC